MRLRAHTEGVTAVDAVAGLVAVWLVLGVLTASGARGRGQPWGFALVSVLLFPVTWVWWYLADGRVEHKGGG